MPSLVESPNHLDPEAIAGGRPIAGPSVDMEGTSDVGASPRGRHTWAGVAEAYATYTSPLRPCRDDVEVVERAVWDWARAHPGQSMRALLLGATPDLATANWPAGATLVAVDSSMSVIKAIWPGDVCTRRWAACGNWLSLPLRDCSCDIVVGDGSLNAFRYPDGWRAAAAAIRDALSERGVLVIRCYVRPHRPEEPEDVIRDLVGPGIADINHFKFRLFLAMQGSIEAGAPVREIYRFLRCRVTDGALRSMPGWSPAAVEGFELWRNADTVYTFPTLSEVREVLGPFLCERGVSFPSYALGDCCPTLRLTRRQEVTGLHPEPCGNTR